MRDVNSLAETRTEGVLAWGLGETIEIRTVLAHVASLLVKVDELAEGADDVNILASPSDAQLGALVKTVVQDFERFEDVTPVLALVVETLVKHIHDFVEVRRAESVLSVLLAIGACWREQTCCR